MLSVNVLHSCDLQGSREAGLSRRGKSHEYAREFLRGMDRDILSVLPRGVTTSRISASLFLSNTHAAELARKTMVELSYRSLACYLA